VKKQAISYIRFSTGKQTKGSSEWRQDAKVRDWLNSHPDYEPSDLSFEDLGKSGWKGAHIEGGMGELLAAVQAGFIRPGAVVLVEALDRAGRLPLMQMLNQVITPILEAGVSLVTMDDGFTYTAESLNGVHAHVLVAKIQAANQFSERLSERVAKSYERRREEAAQGLRPKRRTPLWLDGDGNKIKHLEPHIKAAFELYADGFGERRILRRLQETGIPEFQGLYGSTLKRWLQNKIAIGNWGDIVNVYPAVVDAELFYRVQERIAGNKITRPASPSKHELTGIVKCGHCGRNYNYHVFKEQPTVLQCSNRFMSTAEKCENSKSVPLAVIQYVLLRTSKEARIEAIRKKKLTVNQKRVIVIEGEIASLSQRLQGVARAIAAVGDSPELMEQLSTLTEQRNTLQRELELISASGSDVSIMDQVNDIQITDADPMQLGADLQTVGYTITCDMNGGIFSTHGDCREWEYVGYQRASDSYVVKGGEKTTAIPVAPFREKDGNVNIMDALGLELDLTKE
jgi:DNA invertase Pin-like site-specific DNA recombinase